jgi:hypothetical protein
VHVSLVEKNNLNYKKRFLSGGRMDAWFTAHGIGTVIAVYKEDPGIKPLSRSAGYNYPAITIH